MAEKRMFTKKITETDAFQEMPLSTQALYFHLNMNADDDGFVSNPRKITRMVGASDDDLKLLIIKRFVLTFDSSGVIVIKHWRMHNTLRMDRYHPTEYQEELAMLGLKTNGSYTNRLDCPEIKEMLGAPPVPNHGNHMATTWQPNGNSDLGLDKGLDLGLDSDLEEGLGLDKETSKDCESENSVQTLVREWNRTGFRPIERISKTSVRYKMAKKRIEEYGIDKVLEALCRANKSDFLHGKSDRGWEMDFDWFVKPSNFQKVLEGNYDNRGKKNKTFFDMYKELKDEEDGNCAAVVSY